jgi:hypothetical protein
MEEIRGWRAIDGEPTSIFHDRNSNARVWIQCTDTNRNLVAKWDRAIMLMEVSQRGEGVQDELMVTCMLHQWWIATGRW